MPTKTYYLNEEKTQILTAKWGMFFKNFEIAYNAQSLGTVPTKHALEQGYQFQLPDGRSLVVQLTRNVYQQEVELRLDGSAVPGSAAHPRERLKQAWYATLFIGGFNIILGLIAITMQVALLQSLGFGWLSASIGLLYLGLGWFGYAKVSALAFAIAGVLFVLDGLLTLGISLSASGNPGVGGIFLRFFLTVLLYRGFQAAKQLRAQSQVASTEY